MQKVFHGRSIFGLNNDSVRVGSIILDDSHACIDSISNSFSINIDRKNNENLYMSIISLFEEDLTGQGEGTLLDIKNGEYNAMIPIPYWAWDTKKSEVLEILSKNKENDSIRFAWPLLKDSIVNCRAYISGTRIEILPNHMPINAFGTFHFAKNRILMSATTQNDSFFIKGLGFSVKALRNTLVDNTRKWSGEKMILIPSLIHESLDREEIVSIFARDNNSNLGIVALVPSFFKGDFYSKYGAIIAKDKDIFNLISQFKTSKKKTKTLVIANRYDGIDLPDDSCRILIIDSLPFSQSLVDRNQERCRPNSEIINVKTAQKIEQALGRSVRGEKDFSVIIIIGSDLVKFVKSMNTKKYFSPQTIKQIDIGMEIAEMAIDELNDKKEKDKESARKVLVDLVNQSLKRDDSWKIYYSDNMDAIEDNVSKNFDFMYETLTLEYEAEKSFYYGDYEKACSKIQQIIDNTQDELEKGWYLQELARYKYFLSKIDSNAIQKNAFIKNSQLLKPREGIEYKKIEYLNDNRIKKIKRWISNFNDSTELNLFVDDILDKFSFGIEAEKFEEALKVIGELLGFESQRPDKLIRKGPDNLWCIKNNKYIMFECKSEVNDERNEISKTEVGQMNNHCGWFEGEYGEADVKRILIIPTKELSYYADFTHSVSIMRRGKLKTFKSNIKSYIKEFAKYDIKDISDEKINQIINFHKLDIESLQSQYCENYHKKLKN